MTHFDVIIIGAGAAGLMCAGAASQKNKKVLLIESSKNIGEKIRISGGGRCNFTNLNIAADNFISQNPAFCISALKKFSQFDFINLVKKHNISYHEKTLGQLFCDKSSKQIIEMLVAEFKEGNVDIKTQTQISEIIKKSDRFIIKAKDSEFSCNSLVIATGGLSIPKMGASDFGYKIAKQFGLNIVKTKPALVPLVANNEVLTKTKNLAGISIKSLVSINKRKFEEGLLFTHKGLSGPVILQISSYLEDGGKIEINFANDIDILEFLKNHKEKSSKQEISIILAQILPKRLTSYIVNECQLQDQNRLAEISNKKLAMIAKNINKCQFQAKTTEGYAKAEVTLGGVDTNEISPITFECKKVKNMHFIGEVLDVTGHLGGYNFQWAWSSGFAAGNNLM